MTVEVLPADSWADTVAEELLGRLTAPGLRLCLATGSTPLPVYARLLEESLSVTTVFLLDEFGELPPGHPARCETMLRRALLDRVPAGDFHLLDVDALDVDAECARYQKLINDGGLDLAILGLGINGHLGLNEPGSTADMKTRRVPLTEETREGARRYGAAVPPTWGLTVGLSEILLTREVWLLVTGSTKASILSQVANGPANPEVPASYLQTHPNTIIWADQEAASLL